ncbi:hypothetical protein OIE13_06210 [Streptosporangium sp. NBC_01810]|uniref:hypothetical protein n=1 Tax=Streptosporangium sp. NBC_01810 TaxID=2975951 RepID=UPI002DD8A54C|nr:hypothetical protein [Streptosporangium sp. NBC_01810]WSA27467.1 hypothetical protein OIE13_06210 [Streptosporangium sp. NBC_01810]
MGDDLLEEPLATELGRVGERLLQGRRWFDQPNRRPVFDLRIHRVSDIGAGRDLLYVDVRGNVVDLLVDRSLIRPSLPSLLVQASDEIGRNFA